MSGKATQNMEDLQNVIHAYHSGLFFLQTQSREWPVLFKRERNHFKKQIKTKGILTWFCEVSY